MVRSGRAVVIGGGITGCSVAYHLARAGWREVVLLEKGELGDDEIREWARRSGRGPWPSSSHPSWRS
jgi:glycine/D-amino acid oxidase-like deaminating enzyme